MADYRASAAADAAASADDPVTSAGDYQLSANVFEKLKLMKEELSAPDLDAALDQSLNIAHYVAEILKDSRSKLLIERNGKFQQIKEF